MILDPTTDTECLGKLTQMARELAPTTLLRTVAERLGSPGNVIVWLQMLPQSDDRGGEPYRYVACDVPQRMRLLPDDPNCFERAFAAIALLEVLDPTTQRMLVTIDRPARHTGVVERKGGRWVALDLFPRRNFDWGNFGKDVLQGLHRYVGKPVLSFYGLSGVADQLGDLEDKAIDRDGRSKQSGTKTQPSAQPKSKQPAKTTSKSLGTTSLLSAHTTSTHGGGDHAKEPKDKAASANVACGAGPSADGADDSSAACAATEETERWGRWWLHG
jgi:hypothetical protein